MNEPRALITLAVCMRLTAFSGLLSAQAQLRLAGNSIVEPDLVFEPNLGQSPPGVKFVARFARGTGEVLESCGLSFNGGAVRLSMEGANRSLQPVGGGEQAGKFNYFLGKDPKRWLINVPTYGMVTCRDVYPGVDLRFYGHRQQFELDFVVAPGADPRKIQLSFDGRARLRLDSNGDLVVEDQVRLRRPVVFQETDGLRTEIHAAYDLHARGQARFRLAAYDRVKPLVIDPIVIVAQGGDDISALAVDKAGNLYVAGGAFGAHFGSAGGTPSFGSLAGYCAAYVQKLDSAGSPVYTTFIGGTGCDGAAGIAVDEGGNAYVTGYTSSVDFPTTSNAFQPTLPDQPQYGGQSAGDAFVAKLDPSGSTLVYSTYLGGNGYDRAAAIAVDSSGNAFVGGSTSSTDFPTANAAQATASGGVCPPPDLYLCSDAFVAKLNPAGTELIYSTYLGGNEFDNSNAIALDSLGNAFVTGWTGSENFPILNAVQPANRGGKCNGLICRDAFVSKLSPSGELIYSTYLGGGGNDYGYAIAADENGNVFVAGSTESTDFPTVNPLQSALNACPSFSPWNCADAFVTKLDALGRLLYSTYLGGQYFDGATSIAVDAAGVVSVAGLTVAPDFPTLNPLQAGKITPEDAFVVKLDPSRSALLFSTYFGNCAFGCGTSLASSAVIAERAGDLYVAATVYDATVIWGPVSTSSVIAKIRPDQTTLPQRHGPGGRR